MESLKRYSGSTVYVKSIGANAFFNCANMVEVDLSEGIESIGDNVFQDCRSLKGDIYIPASVSYLSGSAFRSCMNITLVLSPDNETYCSEEGVLFSKDKTTLIMYPVSKTDSKYIIPEGVKEIGDRAFYSLNGWVDNSGVSYLKTVVLPQSLERIGEEAFFNSYCIEKISTEDDDSSDFVFPENMMFIGARAFEDTDSLIGDIFLSSNVTSIGESAFSGAGVNSINVDNNNLQYSSIEGVLYNKEGTILIAFPCGRRGTFSIPDSVISVGAEAFRYSYINEVIVSENVKVIDDRAFEYAALIRIVISDSVVHIGDRAFNTCLSLSDVVLPNDLEEVGSEMFRACSSLNTIDIPDGWKYISTGMFDQSGLNHIIIPKTITHIGGGAFSNCFELEWVRFEGDPPIWGTQIADTDFISDTAFFNTSTKCFYPVDNELWEAQLEDTHGGDIEWEPFDVEKNKNPFVDVAETSYYYDAVLWAYENGITAGKDATHFLPDSTCTRAQVVTFLWRAKGKPEPATTENPFEDVKTTDYYYKAVLWAYENGITTGKDATHFLPGTTVTRNQFVTFLWRAEGKPAASIRNPFVDVSNDQYYTTAVLWAYENGVTTGKDATHFQPENGCTRAQVAAFLYRAYH